MRKFTLHTDDFGPFGFKVTTFPSTGRVSSISESNIELERGAETHPFHVINRLPSSQTNQSVFDIFQELLGGSSEDHDIACIHGRSVDRSGPDTKSISLTFRSVVRPSDQMR
jgi:hypothetical protein